MPTLRYVPGEGVLISSPLGIVLVREGGSYVLAQQGLDDLIDLMNGPGPITTVLDDLLSRGFSAAPTMLLAEMVNGTLRVIVRGLAVDVVRRSGARSTIDGVGVSTLTEFVCDDGDEVILEPAQGPLNLPLIAGVARAGGLRWTLTAAPAGLQASSADPAYTAEPVAVADPIIVAEPVMVAEPVTVEKPVSVAEPVRVAEPVNVAEPAAPLSTLTDIHVTLGDTEDDDEFSHLWESTVMRSVEDAAVRDSEEAAVSADFVSSVPNFRTSLPPTVASDGDPTAGTGDHDGLTIMGSEMADIVRQVRSMNPRPATTLRLRLSTGQVVALDRTVIVGRKPTVTRVSGADIPALIVVPSPRQDISRSHIEFRPVGDGVVAVDLNSMNGSDVFRPGAAAQRLHGGQELAVTAGTTVDIGDGVVIHVEGPT